MLQQLPNNFRYIIKSTQGLCIVLLNQNQAFYDSHYFPYAYLKTMCTFLIFFYRATIGLMSSFCVFYELLWRHFLAYRVVHNCTYNIKQQIHWPLCPSISFSAGCFDERHSMKPSKCILYSFLLLMLGVTERWKKLCELALFHHYEQLLKSSTPLPVIH